MNTPQIKQGWWVSAKAGDKVCCVDGDMGEDPSVLVNGKIYTVVSVFINHTSPCNLGKYTGEMFAVILHEVLNPYSTDKGFAPQRFRPVTPKSTDKAMKAIREHLNVRELAE